ncbi:hypothetical protein M9Y10_024028 [Tritrichomonas musculus]|uniref:Serine-threonine/tyrosine-protein kinase catalytic domain-containing protein n=1 Tax=Tritrichomonas musculus TaxID=1915356 RepID=A0ABR2KWT2_9EUKA
MSPDLNSKMESLLTRCWSGNPKEEPSFEDIFGQFSHILRHLKMPAKKTMKAARRTEYSIFKSATLKGALQEASKKGSMNASYLAGNSHGCNRIGFFYTKGIGKQSDYSKAAEYCQKAVSSTASACRGALQWLPTFTEGQQILEALLPSTEQELR